MLDKFTEKALKAVIISQEEAKKLSSVSIGTEHLLLGLMAEGTGVPVRVLKAVGLTVEQIREQIPISCPKKPDDKSSNTSIIFSNQAIFALKNASNKARELGYIYVGPEHIFISLMLSDDYGSVKLLKDLDVDLARIKATVTRITEKRSENRAHPEIQSSKKLTEISKAIQSKIFELPFNIEDEQTQELINSARQEITNRNNDTIGSDHLLFAFIQSENTHLKDILGKFNIDYNSFSNFLEQNSSRISEYGDYSYQLTPVAYQIFETAQEISVNLGYGTVFPEHILLAILKHDRGLAQEFLAYKDINPREIYEMIVSPIEKQKSPTLAIIRLAQEEARRLDYNVVGTEHMLLGLLCSGTGLAAQVLNTLGITLKDARKEVEKLTGFGDDIYSKDISFTPRAKKLLGLALEEVKKLGGKRIESEHILLAITRIKDCMAMKVLDSLAVDSIEVKHGVMTALQNITDLE